MAARAQGFSLLHSYICYTFTHNITILKPPFFRTSDCGLPKRVVNPAKE
jgi:hypothetical protein